MFQRDPYFRSKFPRAPKPTPVREEVGTKCYCFDCGRTTSRALWLTLPSKDKIKMCPQCVKAYDERNYF